MISDNEAGPINGCSNEWMDVPLVDVPAVHSLVISIGIRSNELVVTEQDTHCMLLL